MSDRHFPKADFYDCDSDAEVLQHTSPDVAVEHYLDGFFTRGTTVGEVVRPVVVGCFRRATVSDAFKERLAERVVELIDEAYGESEYAGPDGDQDVDGKHAALAPARAAVDAYLLNVTIWQCERFAEVELTTEHVEAMMRDHCPEWFEEVTS